MTDEKDSVVDLNWKPKVYFKREASIWRPKQKQHLTKKRLEQFIQKAFRLPEASFKINYFVSLTTNQKFGMFSNSAC